MIRTCINVACAWLQVAHLPRLASLATCNCSFSADSLGALSRLSSSLTRLDVDCGTIPSSLAALMQLRDLRLWDCNPGGDDAVLSAALPHLRQLTRLVRHADMLLPSKDYQPGLSHIGWRGC